MSIAISGNTMVVGANGEDSPATGVNGSQGNAAYPGGGYGAAYVYVTDGATWTQQAYVKPSNTTQAAAGSTLGFGYAVAIDGDTMVVGAQGESTIATGVNGAGSDTLGANQSGAIYVFVRADGVWTQQAHIKANHPDEGDTFGRSVAISGDTIVVGAPAEDSAASGIDGDETDNSAADAGAAYVFFRADGVWTQQAYLKASNPDSYDKFGGAVAISGDVVVVGAVGESCAATTVDGDQNNNSSSGSGAAYVFRRNGGAWTQDAYLKSHTSIRNSSLGCNLGYSVAVSGSDIVVGEPYADRNDPLGGPSSPRRGFAYVFTYNGTAWEQDSYLDPLPTDGNGDEFGHAVGMSRGRVVVAAWTDDDLPAPGAPVSQSGSVYVFKRNGSDWVLDTTHHLKAFNPGIDDVFGTSVAIDGEYIAAGAYAEDGSVPGINASNGSSNNAGYAGAAYLFRDVNWAANAPPIPDLQSYVRDNTDLTVTGVTIIQESALVGGRHLFQLTHNLHNSGSGRWKDTGSEVRETVGTVTFHCLQTAVKLADSLAPGETVRAGANTTLHVVVNASAEAEFTALAGSGQLMRVAAEVSGAVVANPAGATVVGARLIGVTTLASGQKLIEFAGNIRNDGALLLHAVELQVNPAATATSFSSLPGGMTFPGTLAPGATATSTDTFFAICDQPQTAAARAALLDGSAIQAHGYDVMLFRGPTVSFPAGMSATFLPLASSATETDATLEFSGFGSFLQQLENGDLIVDSQSGAYYYQRFAPIPAGDGQLVDFLPFEVTNISQNGATTTLTGKRRSLVNSAKSGTFTGDASSGYHAPVRDPYAPPFGYTHTAAEKAARESQAETIAEDDPFDGRLADLRGFDAMPFHFNDFTLPGEPHVRLSGEVLVSAVPFRFQVTKRDSVPKRLTLHSELSVETNLLLECDTGIGVNFSKETNLFPPIPLPIIPIGGLATIQPQLTGVIGATVNIPEKLSLPLQSSITQGMDVSWDLDSGFTTRTYRETVPLAVSDPSVFQDYQATAEAWAKIGVEFEIHPTAPDIASISASVFGQATASAAIAPLENPWWTLDLGLDVRGDVGLALDFGIAEVPIAGTDFDFKHFDLAHFDAGGPLIGGGAMKPKGPVAPGAEPVRPLSGKSVRWGRTLDTSANGENGGDNSYNLSFTDGSTVCIWKGGVFCRLTAEGDLLWMKSLGGAFGGVALDDNSFIFFQNNGGTAIWHLDADGNKLWVKRYNLNMAPFTGTGRRVSDGMGGTTWEYFIVGYHANAGSLDVAVAKLNATGDVVWIKDYDVNTYDQYTEIRVLSDNNLILAGTTNYQIGANGYNKGLLMKVNGDTGAPAWATVLIGPRFTSVAEAPDGTIFALGNVLVGANRSYPSGSLARFTSAGANTGFVQFGLDPDYTAPAIPAIVYLPPGQIRWANGALWACGELWSSPQRQSWVMRVNEKLAISSFVSFDSDSRSISLHGLGVQSDGIMVTGHTNAGHPWPAGGSDFPVALKLPWEGIMRFHQDVPLRSEFRRPRVFRSADIGDFTSNGVSWVQPTVTSSDLTYTVSSPPWLDPVGYSSAIFIPLERQDPAAIGSYEQWAYYHQLAAPNDGPGDDSDSDGVSNGLEAYFALDPHAPSVLPQLRMETEDIGGENVPVLEFQRAAYAGSLGYGLETSIDLAAWGPLPAGFTVETEPAESALESVRVYSTPPDPRRFFRVSGQPAP